MLKKIFFYSLLSVLVASCGSPNSKGEMKDQAGNVNYIEQGMGFLAKADVSRAIASFDQAIRNEPTNPDNYIVLGEVYLRLESYERAADTLQAATRVAPNNGEIFYLLATSRMLQGPEYRDVALKAAQRASEIYYQNQDKERLAQALMLVKTLTVSEKMPDATDAM